MLPAFTGRVLAIDIAVAQRCATLHVPNQRAERRVLIAATAIVHGMTVVTRNIVDFERTGVAVVNPWNAGDLRWDPDRSITPAVTRHTVKMTT